MVYVLVCSWAWANRLRDILGFDRDQICEAGLQQYVQEVSRERGIEYLNTIDRSTRVIVTRDGRLGLAPSAFEVGDIIAIIRRARASFILRNQGCARRFKVVGQAYIRGIMFGEAREKKGFAFQQIEIC